MKKPKFLKAIAENFSSSKGSDSKDSKEPKDPKESRESRDSRAGIGSGSSSSSSSANTSTSGGSNILTTGTSIFSKKLGDSRASLGGDGIVGRFTRRSLTGNSSAEEPNESSKQIEVIVDALDTTGLMSRASYSLQDLPQDMNAKKFKEVLNAAINGSVSIVVLLEAMFLLQENLPADVYVQLFKYLSKLENLKVMVKLLTAPEFEDFRRDRVVDDVRCQARSPYVVSMVLSTGPYQVRRVLSLNPPLVEVLLKYFESPNVLDPIGTVRVSRVLFALISDNPQDTVKVMAKRKGSIKCFVSKMYSVPVAELLPQIFSTSQADSMTTLKFGPPNVEGIPLLAESQIYDLIADVFCEACKDKNLSENYNHVALIENAPRCISIISMRAMATLPFDRENCNFDKTMIKKLNTSLEYLNVLHSPGPLTRMVDAALEATQSDPLCRALRSMVNALIDILFAYHSGCKASSGAVRKALLLVNLDPFEQLMCARIERFTELLKIPLGTLPKGVDLLGSIDQGGGDMLVSIPEPGSNSAFGTVRLKIIEMMIFLFAFQSPTTVQELVHFQTPKVLMDLLIMYNHNSMLQNLVAMGIETSMIGQNAELKVAWLKDAKLMEHLIRLWTIAQAEEKRLTELEAAGLTEDGSMNNVKPIVPINCRGWVIRVSKALRAFLDKNKTLPDKLDVDALLGTELVERFLLIESEEVSKFTQMERIPLGGDVPKRAFSILRNLQTSQDPLLM